MTYFDLTWVIGNPPADELVANHQRTHTHTLANFERMHLRTNLCQILNQFHWHVPFSVSTWPQCLSKSPVNQVKHILRNHYERKFKDISCYIINNNAYHVFAWFCGYFIHIDGTASTSSIRTTTNCQLQSDIICMISHTEIRFLLDLAQVSGVAHSSQAPCELHQKLWQTRLWPAHAEIGPPQIAKLVSHTRLSSITTHNIHFWWILPGCLLHYLHCHSVQAAICLIFMLSHVVAELL